MAATQDCRQIAMQPIPTEVCLAPILIKSEKELLMRRPASVVKLTLRYRSAGRLSSKLIQKLLLKYRQWQQTTPKVIRLKFVDLTSVSCIHENNDRFILNLPRQFGKI